MQKYIYIANVKKAKLRIEKLINHFPSIIELKKETTPLCIRDNSMYFSHMKQT